MIFNFESKKKSYMSNKKLEKGKLGKLLWSDDNQDVGKWLMIGPCSQGCFGVVRVTVGMLFLNNKRGYGMKQLDKAYAMNLHLCLVIECNIDIILIFVPYYLKT